MSTAVVVGGGISGLSSAFYLQKSSRFSKIIVLEASDRFGGWMKTIRHEDGAKMELGPRSIRPVGAVGFNTLCMIDDLGISDDVVSVLKKEPSAQNRFIYTNNTLNKLPNKFSALFSRQPPFAKSLFTYVLHDLRTPKGNLKDESVYDFFSRRLDEDVAKNAIDPMCRGIFAGDARKMSIRSSFPILAEAEDTGGSIIKGMFRKKRPARRRQCSLSNKCTQERWAAYSFKSGMQHFSESLAGYLESAPEVELVRNTACSSIAFTPDKRASVEINGATVAADHVVSSVYAAQLANMLPPEYSEMKACLNKIPAITAVVVCLEFDGTLSQPPMPGFGYLLPSFENEAVLGVIYDSCTFPQHDRTDRPSTRYTVMMGGAWHDSLKTLVPSMSDEDLGQYAVQSVQKQLNITETPVKVHVEQLSNCIPQYLLGHETILSTLSSEIESRGLPLSLVGSSYRGPGLNDCINGSRLAVEKITGKDLQ